MTRLDADVRDWTRLPGVPGITPDITVPNAEPGKRIVAHPKWRRPARIIDRLNHLDPLDPPRPIVDRQSQMAVHQRAKIPGALIGGKIGERARRHAVRR